MKSLRNVFDQLKRQFPQINNHLIIRELPQKHPFELYLFWFFNSAGLTEAARKAGENRDILLLIDLTQKRAGLTVCYGLEAFLPEETLDQIPQGAAPAFAGQRLLDALLAIYAGLERELIAAANQIKEATSQIASSSHTLVPQEF